VELAEPATDGQSVVFDFQNDFGIFIQSETVDGNKFATDVGNLSRGLNILKSHLQRKSFEPKSSD
jgi:hypothetical protein